ncbi:phage tail assembly protein, partial [Salmonella enterica subsp. enterica serovar Give]
MKELELKKPIIAHGETLSVLEFDEPTGKDVRELGYPYQMNQDESVRLLAHVVSKYIVRLAKVPQSS